MRGSVSMQISLMMNFRCVCICMCVYVRKGLHECSCVRVRPLAVQPFLSFDLQSLFPLSLSPSSLSLRCLAPDGSICRLRSSTISGWANSKTTSRRFSCLSRPSKPQWSQPLVSGGMTTIVALPGVAERRARYLPLSTRHLYLSRRSCLHASWSPRPP